MARIRAIKPGFFRDGDLYDAEAETGLPLRVAYAGLWTVADRAGLFKWKPREIKTEVLPYDNVNMSDVLDALERCGKLLKYESDGQEYGWIISFLVHQYVNKHEAKSTLPKPSEYKNARAGTRRTPSGKEGKGKEGKGNIPAGAAAPFDDFWKVYPRREAKGAAEKAFLKALEFTTPEVLIGAAGAYAIKRRNEDQKFTKLPATWLNQKCWTDEGLAPAVPLMTPEQAEEMQDRRDRLMKQGKYDPMRQMQ